MHLRDWIHDCNPPQFRPLLGPFATCNRDGLFTRNFPRWDFLERQLAEYAIRSEIVSAPSPVECAAPMAETLESDLPLATFERDGRSVSYFPTLDDIEDSSLDPARMDDDERAAIVAGELHRQFQPVPEMRRYAVNYCGRRKYVFTSSDELAAWNRAGGKWAEKAKAVLAFTLADRCRKDEIEIPATRYRMADSEPSAFLAAPRHITPLATSTVADSDGRVATRFEAYFVAELPFLPAQSRFPAPSMSEIEIDRAIDALTDLKASAAMRQAQAEPLRYVTHRPAYWLEKMYSTLIDV